MPVRSKFDIFFQVIKDTISACAPTKRPVSRRAHINLVPWWDAECDRAKRLRRAANRLQWWAETNNWLPLCQHGFRKGNSCIDNLAGLTMTVQSAFKERRDVYATFLDIEGAIDNVNIDILIQRLADLGTFLSTIRFIKFITAERHIFTSKHKSPHLVSYKGLPQGANLPESVSASCFADDTALYIKSDPHSSSIQTLEKAIKILDQNITNLGLSIAPHESKFLHFSRTTKSSKQQIKIKRRVKFLGITFDPRLDFHLQAEIHGTTKKNYPGHSLLPSTACDLTTTASQNRSIAKTSLLTKPASVVTSRRSSTTYSGATSTVTINSNNKVITQYSKSSTRLCECLPRAVVRTPKARATRGLTTAMNDGLQSPQGQTSVEKSSVPSLTERTPLSSPRTSPSTIVKAISEKIIVAPLHCKEKDFKLPSLSKFTTGTTENKLERMDGLIRGLGQFLRGKTNLHKEVFSYQVSLGMALSALEKSLRSRVLPRPPTADKAVCTSPLFTGCAMSKRPAESSPEMGIPSKRSAGVTGPIQSDENNNVTEDCDNYVLVDHQRRRRRKPQPQLPPERDPARWSLKPRPQHRRVHHRPDAIIIKAKDASTYAEILKKLKREPALQQTVGSSVNNIRRSAAGTLVLQLKKGVENAPALGEELGKVLGTAATASALLHTSTIEIKDLDECATKEEVTMALDALLGAPVSKRDPVKSLRKAYAGTQVAVVALPDDLAATALKLGHVRIGWLRAATAAEVLARWPHAARVPTARSSTIDAARRVIRQRTAEANHHASSARNEELTTITTLPQARAALWPGRSPRTADDENSPAEPQSLRGCPGPALRYHQQAAHRRGHPVQGSSIVDVTFVCETLTPRVKSWTVSGWYTHSNHQAIVFEIEDTRTSTRPSTRQSCRWNARTLDADRFSASVSSASVASGTAEDMASSLMSVTGACDASMSKVNPRRRREPVYWWTAKIADLWRSCLRAQRLFQRSRGRQYEETHSANYASTRHLLRVAIKTSKRRCWAQLCDEVNSDVWDKPYKIVMSRLRCPQTKQPSSPLLVRSAVAALFPRVPSGPTLRLPRRAEEPIPAVTLNELKGAQSRIKERSTPGPDGIPNSALKIAIASRPDIFLRVYTTCLETGVFPSGWKRQRLVLLPKSGKPPDEPSSYRMLCMLDTAGKILERIICDRLEAFIERPRGLSERQYGYRKGRSTIDAIEDVISTVRNAVAGRRSFCGTKKYCAVVTFDVRNAFNSARWDNILAACSCPITC
ncbi:unnamed protein product [Trichogramma brassicae]|uniref:Reverse transcriptase domain-containing protein n=1 Tax=Trichogramma brassicae TaxID=86971 RepID=A0A6H5IJG5_9HYME|nr:unnamed protein product [Trichogramma brassicae]